MPSLAERFFRRKRPVDTDGILDIPHNPAGGEFMDSVKSSIRQSIDKFSVTANSLVIGNNSFARGGNPFGAAGVLAGNTNTDSSFGNTDLGLALPVDTNKIARIQSYDNIARYPELDWCINEIANDFLHEDINGEYFKLKLKCDDSKFTNGEDTILKEEFKHLVSMYDLRTVGYNMIRKFLIEGEICFENVIDHNHPEYGIIGFKYIPTMFYDFLRNRRTGQIEGLYIDPERLKTYTQFSAYGGTSYAGQSSTVFNAIRQIPAYSYTYSLDMKNKIVMPFEQVTYMNSGVLSEDGSVVFPTIEKVAVPTRQLLLMHDAIVIYRITRAPEKLVFNVDLAGMPAKKAEAKVREMAMAHKSRKAVQGSGAVTNVYNAETMLDAYYFWKIGEGAGTTVTNLASTSHYNELHDVEYFLRRILKFLNIPWQRWAENAANRQDKQSIQNEEYSFAKSIVRYQTMFSAAVKKTYITHLRMKGTFRKFDLHESEIEVEMIPPALFETYQAQTRFKDALDIINSASSLDFISKNILLKTVFNWTDSQIKENEVETRREALYKAQTEWMGQQLASANGKIYLDADKYVNAAAGGMPGAAGGGAQMPGGADAGAAGGMPEQGGDVGGAPAPGADGGAEAVAPQSAGDTLDLGTGGNPEDAAANAGFDEFSGAGNINQASAQELSAKDDSGKSQAEIDATENPEYGDFGELNKERAKDKPKFYPETDSGLRGLDNPNGKESLSGVFKDAFGKNERKTTGTLTDTFKDAFGETQYPESEKTSMSKVFDDVFGKSGESGKKGTLSDVFKKEFRKVKTKRSLSSVFKKEFAKLNAENSDTEKSDRGSTKKAVKLGTALDRMFA